MEAPVTALSRTALLLALALLAACGKPAGPVAAGAVAAPPAPEAPPQAGSCLTQAIGVCQDFHGAGHSAIEVRSTCTAQNLRYARGACPLEERIGSCLLFGEQPTASRLRYYAPFGLGVEGARQQCEGKLAGRWLPG